MNTIDEMADAYCREHAQQEGYDAEDVRTAYISGAEHVYEELTRWNDPKHTPTADVRILIKWRRKKDYREIITVGTYDGRNWSGDSISYPYMLEIIGWREIH